MALLHPHSNECVNSELDLFQVPLTQTSIIGGEWVEYNPTSSITDNTSITFKISGNSDTYIDLGKTLVYVQVDIRKEDGTLPQAASLGPPATPADAIGPVNLCLQSLFSEVHLSLNERSVTPSAQNYPYKSMIQTLLTFGDSAKESFLTSSLFYKDTPGKFDDFNENNGLKKRATFAQKGTFDMIGVLHTEMCQQPRYLINLVDLKFKLVRSSDAFCLQASEKCKVTLKAVSLYIRKVKLIPELILGHAKALEFGTVKYPITRSECTSFTIPQGNMSTVQDHLFTGQIPKKVVIGLVDQRAYLGAFEKSPFNFQNFGLNHIALYVDGASVPHKPLTPNFDSDLFIQSYINLFLQTGQWNIDEGNAICRDSFKNGCCLFTFDLTADLTHSANQLHLVKNGNLRLELKFARPLPESVCVLVYAENQSIVEIDRNRTVIFDYSN